MVGLGGRSSVTRCHDCKRRKLKCDGIKPSCSRCVESRIQCGGYERVLEFVFFDGDSYVKPSKPTSSENYLKRSKLDQGIQPNPRNPITSEAITYPEKRPVPFNNQVIIRFNEQNLTASQNKAGFLSVLLNRYLPDLGVVFSRERQGLCPSWITSVFDISNLSGSERLNDVLLAISLSVVGTDLKNDVYSTAGLQHYSQALYGLRSGILLGPTAAVNEFQMDVNLLTCLCCGMFEMLSYNAVESFVQHLQGVGAIFKARGVENLQTPISRRTLYEFRAIQLPLSLITRRLCFLSSPEWVNPPWKSQEPNSTSHLQTIIDLGLRIPPLMEQFDKTKIVMRLVPFRNSMNARILYGIIHEGLSIEREVERWEYEIRGGSDMLPLVSIMPGTSHLGGIISEAYPTGYSFPNFEIAAAMAFCEMIKIYLYQLLIDTATFVHDIGSFTPLESLPPYIDIQLYTAKTMQSADWICQCANYFLEDHRQALGRQVIMAPLDAAKNFLTKLLQNGTNGQEQDQLLQKKVEYCYWIMSCAKATGLQVWST